MIINIFFVKKKKKLASQPKLTKGIQLLSETFLVSHIFDCDFSPVGDASVLCQFSQRGDGGYPGGSHHARLPAVCVLHHQGERTAKHTYSLHSIKTNVPYLNSTLVSW